MSVVDRRLRTALLPYQPRLLHDVLDSLDVPVVVLDDTWGVLAGNVAASHHLGIRRGRRADDGPLQLVVSITDEAGDEVDLTDTEYWLLRADAHDAPVVRVAYEDGTARWFATCAHRVHDAVVCRYSDVTTQRELERRVAAAADQAARAEIDLVAAEQRVALLEDLLVYVTTRAD
jgi:PAS domain-containing protein